MPDVPEKECRGTLHEGTRMLLASHNCRLMEPGEITEAIRDAGRGKRWAWVDKWVTEEGPKWVNDMDTVVFVFPPEDLTTERCLEFTQMVWRLQPSVFEYQVWGGRCFVRMWWDRHRRATLGHATA